MSEKDTDNGSSGLTTNRRTYLAGTGAAGFAATAGCTGIIGSGGGGGTIINILTWSDFKKGPTTKSIEDSLGITLNVKTSTSSTEMFSKWNRGSDEEYDIAVPNNNLVPRFLGADLIEPVDTNAVSNYSNIYEKFQSFADQQFTQSGNVYGVPIRWGWYGYAYDTRNVSDHEPSYRVLFEDDYVDTELNGEIIMYDEAAKTVPVAALYLASAHGDPSFREALTENSRMTFTEEQIDEIRDLLADQKSSLEGYIDKDAEFITQFQEGNFLVGHCGRQEVIRLWQNKDADWVEFVVPKEGAMAWYETAVVSSQSNNIETAFEVVNEYISPGPGTDLSRQGKAPSCNPTVAKELSDDEQELFGQIDPERFEQFVPFKDISPDVAKQYNSAWEEIKA
jgi:Spermidine/putrescine-binding periplasmic protein